MFKILKRSTYLDLIKQLDVLKVQNKSVDETWRSLYKTQQSEEQSKIIDTYFDYKGIATKSFNKSEKSFLTLADNLFFLAAKEKPELLDAMEERIASIKKNKAVKA